MSFSCLIMSHSSRPVDCSTPGLPVPPHLLEFAQVHVHYIGDAIQPSHPLLPSFSASNLSQHRGLSLVRRLSKEVVRFTQIGQFFQFFVSVQFSSVAQSCPTLCDAMNHSMAGLPVHQQLLEFTQTYVHRVGDAIQPSYPLSSPSPPAPNPSQH